MPTSRTFQLDVDTKRYIARVNVYRKLNGLGNLLPPDVADIDNFVVGLKDLGVWGNTVCWLMGSRYNVGAGTIILSIGAGGVCDGSVVGSPTWSSNGIIKDASSHTISVQNINRVINAPSLGWTTAANGPTAYDNLRQYFSGDLNSGGPNVSVQSFYSTTTSNFTARCSRSGAFSQCNAVSFTGRAFLYNFTSLMFGRNSDFAQANATFGTTRTGLAARDVLSNWATSIPLVGAYGTNLSMYGIYSFMWWNLTELTQNQFLSIYNLYKTSIGKNLSLP